MYAKLLGFLLFACRIIFNESHVIRETKGDIINFTPTLAPALPTLPEGYVRFPDLHTAYKVYRTGMPWVQARRQCIAEGADLAIIDTVEKIQRVYAVLKDWFVTNYISVGIRRSNMNTEDWFRVDNGLPLASLPWEAYRPDPYWGGDWNCAAINFFKSTLSIMPCDALNSWYVCEISMVPVINSTPTPAPASSTLPEIVLPDSRPINTARSCAKLSYSYRTMVTSFIVLIIVHCYGIL